MELVCSEGPNGQRRQRSKNWFSPITSVLARYPHVERSLKVTYLSSLAMKAGSVLAAAFLASAVSSTAVMAEEATATVTEVEILVTYDNEVLTVGEEGDVESVDAYLEETYGSDEVRLMGDGYGYTTNGTLHIHSNSAAASINYYKSAGSTISVQFRNYYSAVNKGTAWNCPQRISSGNRGGCTARHPSGTGGSLVRGEMSVSGSSTVVTTYTSKF